MAGRRLIAPRRWPVVSQASRLNAGVQSPVFRARCIHRTPTIPRRPILLPSKWLLCDRLVRPGFRDRRQEIERETAATNCSSVALAVQALLRYSAHRPEVLLASAFLHQTNPPSGQDHGRHECAVHRRILANPFSRALLITFDRAGGLPSLVLASDRAAFLTRSSSRSGTRARIGHSRSAR